MAEDYYIEMDGSKCDRKLSDLADGAVAGGDGWNSIDQAKALTKGDQGQH